MNNNPHPVSDDPCPHLRGNPFTVGETRILRELAAGKSAPEISRELGYRPQTVAITLTRMAGRVNARTREQLLAIALRKAWIT